jgi:Tfp pilus assembly protein PilX
MEIILRNSGSVIIVVIFAIALLSVVTMGILQMNTEEIQLMQNQIFAAQALATAEAGLNDAFARIRSGSDPNIADEPFNGGIYDVNITGTPTNRTVTSTGTTSQSFIARVEADITVGTSSPHVVRIDNLRINE